MNLYQSDVQVTVFVAICGYEFIALRLFLHIVSHSMPIAMHFVSCIKCVAMDNVTVADTHPVYGKGV